MNNKKSNDATSEQQREAEDRLIDWGLRTGASLEETPNLKDRILGAAAAEQVVARDSSHGVTTVQSHKQRKATARHWWIGVAAAALLAFASMYGVNQIRLAQHSEPLETLSSESISYDESMDTSMEERMGDIELPPDRFEAMVKLAVVDGEEKELRGTDLMMSVTPRIIIQEESKEALGVRFEPTSQPVVDLDVGFTQGSFASGSPASDGYGDEGGYGGEGGMGGGGARGVYGGEGVDGGGMDGYGRDADYGLADASGGATGFGMSSQGMNTRRGGVREGYYRPAVQFGSDSGVTPSSDRLSVVEHRIAHSNQQRDQLLTVLQQQLDGGRGSESGGDKYDRIHENAFIVANGTDAVSTFSIDVDTASYTNVRQFLMKEHRLPPPDAVRLEELLNYFDYDYASPDADAEHPFVTHTEIAGCPWNEEHRLVRLAIQGREVEEEKRPLSNLVFLVDVSGSMNEPNKLPLVVEGLTHMARELGENDRVSIVVYAGSEGLALPSTRGDHQDVIRKALGQLSAGGSTAGGAGIQLAYQVAEQHFIQGGSNRVILCTDGDFNVGVTSTADLERLAETKAAETGVFLTVLGFGRGNLNDAMMETISNRGNGNYYYIDSLREVRRVLVQQLSGTLVTIAKDVKIQVEFNPANVACYRLLGYENRMLARQDFDDDTKDAGEVGAGHAVTALYEIVPVGGQVAAKGVANTEPLKYQTNETAVEEPQNPVANAALNEFSDELLTLRLRYKLPAEDTSTKIEVTVKDDDGEFNKASGDFRFAASVAGFGMLLRDSQYKGDATFSSIREVAAEALGEDRHGYRAEFLELIDAARKLK